MPVDPPPLGSPELREALDARYRELMAEAAERVSQMAVPNSWLMVPGSDTPADGICDVVTHDVRCTTGASWRIWVGCTQEHLVEGYTCAMHLELIEADCRRNWCAQCRGYNQAQLLKPEAERSPQVSELWQVLRKVAA